MAYRRSSMDGQEQGRRRRPVWSLAVASTSVLACAGAQATQAASPRVWTAAPVPPVCAWRSISSASTGNVDYADANTTSWLSYYYAHKGLLLHITGRFPYARYMSFSVQPVHITADKSIVFDRPVGYRLDDVQISPSAGNVNPFKPGSNRAATKRTYSVWVRFKAPSTDSQGSSLFAGTSGLGALTYRVDAPEKGQPATGGVPLPAIDKVVVTGQGTKPQVIHVPLCATTTPVRATAAAHRFASVVGSWPALAWHHVITETSTSPGYSSLATRLTRSASLVVVRFKAPTFVANTGPITGREQVRYWSLCAYGLTSGRLAGCVADDQARRDTRGYATIVLGDATQRPAADTLQAANWLTFSQDQQQVLIYRQLLSAPAFTASISNAAGNSTIASRMGAYYPVLTTCSLARWNKDGCGAAR